MNRFFPHRHGRDGMVLMEVLVALTVFALVAFSLVSALDAAMDAAKERNEIDTVMRGLQNQLALVHSSPLIPGEKDLSDDGSNSGVTYHLEIAPESMKDQKGQAVPSIFRVTVSASWKSGTNTEDRSVSELIFQP